MSSVRLVQLTPARWAAWDGPDRLRFPNSFKFASWGSQGAAVAELARWGLAVGSIQTLSAETQSMSFLVNP